MSQSLHPRMDMPMDGMVMMMTPYLHFTTDYGDPLWFAAWAPVSSGAIAGACIGLVMLAMFERLLNGIRGVLEQEWVVRSRQAIQDGTVVNCCDTDLPTSNSSSDVKESAIVKGKADSIDEKPIPSLRGAIRQTKKAPPFIASHDIARGVTYVSQAAVGYLLMLAVMTWNTAYTLSIILGLGLGETMFGRFAGAGESHH